MRKFIFILCAFAFFGQGITSILAATATPSLVAGSARAAERSFVSPVTSVVAVASPLEQSVSREDLILLLVRMGYFYAGFLCLLCAIEFGTKLSEDPTAS